MRGSAVVPGGPRELYSASAPAERIVYRRLRLNPLLTLVSLALAAALCVTLLLSRARLMSLEDECDGLAGRITELADENSRLTIELESRYSLAEIEEYARNELGMTPG